MDPYLEDPGLWPDVHHELISEIRAALNVQLRPNYFARVEERVYLSDENDPTRTVVIPDVRVTHQRRNIRQPAPAAGQTETAVLEQVQPLEVTTFLEEEIHESLLQVIDRKDRSVVAVIEVLSPANKTPGSPGRQSYLEKRLDVMRSPAHLIEIDLLRAGARIFVQEKLPPHDYLVHVSRVKDNGRRRATVWPIPLASRLPAIPVPLRHNDPDASIDLQAVLATAFERGAYDLDLDYSKEPVPPVTGERAGWVRQVAAAANQPV
jgi:hypothetical protein